MVNIEIFHQDIHWFCSFLFFSLALTSVLTIVGPKLAPNFLKKGPQFSYKVLVKVSEDLGIFNNYLLHCCCLNITYAISVVFEIFLDSYCNDSLYRFFHECSTESRRKSRFSAIELQVSFIYKYSKMIPVRYNFRAIRLRLKNWGLIIPGTKVLGSTSTNSQLLSQISPKLKDTLYQARNITANGKRTRIGDQYLYIFIIYTLKICEHIQHSIFRGFIQINPKAKSLRETHSTGKLLSLDCAANFEERVYFRRSRT